MLSKNCKNLEIFRNNNSKIDAFLKENEKISKNKIEGYYDIIIPKHYEEYSKKCKLLLEEINTGLISIFNV